MDEGKVYDMDEDKVYIVQHGKLNTERGIILLPIGIFYNREIQQARAGEFIQMWDGKPRRIKQLCRLSLESPAGRFMCRCLYNTKIENVLRRWQVNAVMEGANKGAVSTVECLMIQYETDGERQI